MCLGFYLGGSDASVSAETNPWLGVGSNRLTGHQESPRADSRATTARKGASDVSYGPPGEQLQRGAWICSPGTPATMTCLFPRALGPLALLMVSPILF